MVFYQWKFSIGNDTLPVEIVHRKWHFTSGNCPWEMVFYHGNLTWEMPFHQWKFSIGNDILPVENFYGKWHYASGNYCIHPSFGKLDCFYHLRHIISIFPVEIWQNLRWLW